jgi:preprotein translocase subunit YajC
MELSNGDWVQTDSGLSGRIVHVSRLTAFVELELEGGKEVLPILLSELIRVDPAQPPTGPTQHDNIVRDEPKLER